MRVLYGFSAWSASAPLPPYLRSDRPTPMTPAQLLETRNLNQSDRFEWRPQNAAANAACLLFSPCCHSVEYVQSCGREATSGHFEQNRSRNVGAVQSCRPDSMAMLRTMQHLQACRLELQRFYQDRVWLKRYERVFAIPKHAGRIQILNANPHRVKRLRSLALLSSSSAKRSKRQS